MFLNYEEIKSLSLISNADASEFANASYNLTVGKIFDMDGKEVTGQYKIKPQGMAYVVFKETVTVPDNIIGFAHVKTTLTKRGIMATNIGIIDPNYVGLISTLLINFGKIDFPIEHGDPGLRISFANIKAPSIPIAVKKSEEKLYIKTIKSDINFLDEKFLNLNNIENVVIWNLVGKFFKVGAVFTALAFVAATIFNVINFYDKSRENAIKEYKTSLAIQEEKNKYMVEKLTNYERTSHQQDSLLQNQMLLLKSQLEEVQKKLKPPQPSNKTN